MMLVKPHEEITPYVEETETSVWGKKKYKDSACVILKSEIVHVEKFLI